MSISKESAIIIAILLIYIGGDVYTANVKHKMLEKHIKESQDWALTNTTRNIAMMESVDSLRLQVKGLGKSVLYLDSCQQNKTIKQDRAERRGKFVGGLLKSLIPGM
jgi:hypothetical protein